MLFRSGAAVPCKVEPGLGADNSVVRFVPREEGPYEVEVTYDGVPVPGSPFSLEAVPPTKPSKVRGVPGPQPMSALDLTPPLGPSERGPCSGLCLPGRGGKPEQEERQMESGWGLRVKGQRAGAAWAPDLPLLP